MKAVVKDENNGERMFIGKKLGCLAIGFL